MFTHSSIRISIYAVRYFNKHTIRFQPLGLFFIIWVFYENYHKFNVKGYAKKPIPSGFGRGRLE